MTQTGQSISFQQAAIQAQIAQAQTASGSKGNSSRIYQKDSISDLDVNNPMADTNSEMVKRYMSQTQKPGNVPNASVAAYNEAAQNYMISIVQNVYVGGPSLNQTQTHYLSGPGICRSQNTSKRQMRAPRRLTSDYRNQVESQGRSAYNEPPPKRVGHSLGTKGSFRNSKSKSNLGLSSNQSAINHYLQEIQATGQDSGASSKKRKQRKTVQGQRYFYPIYDVPYHNPAQQPAQTIKKFVKSGSKLVIGQSHPISMSMQRPSKQQERIQTAIPTQLMSDGKNKIQHQGNFQNGEQSFSQLSLMSSPLQSPKSQDEVVIEDPQRRNTRIQNFTPGGESFSSPQIAAIIDSPKEFPSSIKENQGQLSQTQPKQKQSRNGTINLRQSQVNFSGTKTQANNVSISKNPNESIRQDQHYKTHTSVRTTKKHSGLQISQVAPEKRVFKVRPHAVKFSKDASDINNASNREADNHEGSQKSKRLADQSFHLLDKNAQKSQKKSFKELMGGAEERDDAFQFTNEIKERADIEGILDEDSSSDGEVKIDQTVSEKNADQLLVNSSSSRVRQNFYGEKMAEKNRRINNTNSGQNSQSSFKALLSSQMHLKAKESKSQQRASQGAGAQIGMRNHAQNHTQNFQERGRVQSTAHGNRLSAKGLSNRASINGANLIYNSTDTRSFKRIFTGHRGKAPHPGVLPKIDSANERIQNQERRPSFQQLQDKQEQRTERQEQLLSLSSQPRIQDFQESRRDKPKMEGYVANTQPSIQLGPQNIHQNTQGSQSVKNNGSLMVNQEVLQLKQANPSRRNIDQKIIQSNQHQSQSQEQKAVIGSRVSSRNKSNQQNQTQQVISQPFSKPLNQKNTQENQQLFQSPQQVQKKPTLSPRDDVQMKSNEEIIGQANIQTSSKQRTHTSQGSHMGRRGMAEAKYKNQRKGHRITDSELDRKIQQQLLIKQQNQQNQKSHIKNSQYYIQQVNDFLAKQEKESKSNAKDKNTEKQRNLNARRASKDMQQTNQDQQQANSKNTFATPSANQTHQQRSNSRTARMPSNRITQNTGKPGRSHTSFIQSSEVTNQQHQQSQATTSPQQPNKQDNQDQEKESGRRVVVKNLIIQNSNLQNCNVYIGGGNEDEKKVTIVHKNDDPREQNASFSDLQRIEMSPVAKNQTNDKSKPKLSDFKITKQIGEGHQGKVVQAQDRKTGRVYALKIIPQRLIKEQKQIQHIFNEKQMLTKLRKDFRYFPKIYSTFSDKVGPVSSVPNSAGLGPSRGLGQQGQNGGQCLVFQMSLIEGVNLFKFQKHNLCIELGIVRYFAAQALMIVDYLQDQNLIYRDVKPENFMVEFESGNLKLVDFGFAKQLKYEKSNGLFQGRGRTFTKCGTPEYMAPEVIQQKELNNTETRVSQSSFLSKQLGYSLECDTWSWGVMLCEMVGGFNPFSGGNVQQTFDNILSLNINWPKNISKQCKNLLQSIFVVDPNLRASIQEIKKHPFFHGYQWHDLENSLAPESKDELMRLLQEIKEQNDKEDLKYREQRENSRQNKGLSVQTKNLNNQPYLTEVTEEDKRNDPADHVDSARFSQLVQDYDEISPIDILQPKSAGLPFKMKFLSPNVMQESESRTGNMSDFSMRKNMLAFKDF